MNRNDERSVSDVLQDIFGNVQDIVRSEVRLGASRNQDRSRENRKGCEIARSPEPCWRSTLAAYC